MHNFRIVFRVLVFSSNFLIAAFYILTDTSNGDARQIPFNHVIKRDDQNYAKPSIANQKLNSKEEEPPSLGTHQGILANDVSENIFKEKQSSEEEDLPIRQINDRDTTVEQFENEDDQKYKEISTETQIETHKSYQDIKSYSGMNDNDLIFTKLKYASKKPSNFEENEDWTTVQYNENENLPKADEHFDDPELNNGEQSYASVKKHETTLPIYSLEEESFPTTQPRVIEDNPTQEVLGYEQDFAITQPVAKMTIKSNFPQQKVSPYDDYESDLPPTNVQGEILNHLTTKRYKHSASSGKHNSTKKRSFPNVRSVGTRSFRKDGDLELQRQTSIFEELEKETDGDTVTENQLKFRHQFANSDFETEAIPSVEDFSSTWKAQDLKNEEILPIKEKSRDTSEPSLLFPHSEDENVKYEESEAPFTREEIIPHLHEWDNDNVKPLPKVQSGNSGSNYFAKDDFMTEKTLSENSRMLHGIDEISALEHKEIKDFPTLEEPLKRAIVGKNNKEKNALHPNHFSSEMLPSTMKNIPSELVTNIPDLEYTEDHAVSGLVHGVPTENLPPNFESEMNTQIPVHETTEIENTTHFFPGNISPSTEVEEATVNVVQTVVTEGNTALSREEGKAESTLSYDDFSNTSTNKTEFENSTKKEMKYESVTESSKFVSKPEHNSSNLVSIVENSDYEDVETRTISLFQAAKTVSQNIQKNSENEAIDASLEGKTALPQSSISGVERQVWTSKKTNEETVNKTRTTEEMAEHHLNKNLNLQEILTTVHFIEEIQFARINSSKAVLNSQNGLPNMRHKISTPRNKIEKIGEFRKAESENNVFTRNGSEIESYSTAEGINKSTSISSFENFMNEFIPQKIRKNGRIQANTDSHFMDTITNEADDSITEHNSGEDSSHIHIYQNDEGNDKKPMFNSNYEVTENPVKTRSRVLRSSRFNLGIFTESNVKLSSNLSPGKNLNNNNDDENLDIFNTVKLSLNKNLSRFTVDGRADKMPVISISNVTKIHPSSKSGSSIPINTGLLPKGASVMNPSQHRTSTINKQRNGKEEDDWLTFQYQVEDIAVIPRPIAPNATSLPSKPVHLSSKQMRKNNAKTSDKKDKNDFNKSRNTPVKGRRRHRNITTARTHKSHKTKLKVNGGDNFTYTRSSIHYYNNMPVQNLKTKRTKMRINVSTALHHLQHGIEVTTVTKNPLQIIESSKNIFFTTLSANIKPMKNLHPLQSEEQIDQQDRIENYTPSGVSELDIITQMTDVLETARPGYLRYPEIPTGYLTFYDQRTVPTDLETLTEETDSEPQENNKIDASYSNRTWTTFSQTKDFTETTTMDNEQTNTATEISFGSKSMTDEINDSTNQPASSTSEKMIHSTRNSRKGTITKKPQQRSVTLPVPVPKPENNTTSKTTNMSLQSGIKFSPFNQNFKNNKDNTHRHSNITSSPISTTIRSFSGTTGVLNMNFTVQPTRLMTTSVSKFERTSTFGLTEGNSTESIKMSTTSEIFTTTASIREITTTNVFTSTPNFVIGNTKLNISMIKNSTLGIAEKLPTTLSSEELDVLSFHFTIRADYAKVVGSRKEEFQEHLKKQLARTMRLPLKCIHKLEVVKGSIEVSFNLIPSSEYKHLADETSLKAAVDELKRLIDSRSINFSDLDGNELYIIPIDPPSTPSPKGIEPEQMTLILAVVISVFVMTITILAVTAIVMKKKWKNAENEQFFMEEARRTMPLYRDIPMQEAFFLKGGGVGKYCYDSGMWSSTGPEHSAPDTPEPCCYQPQSASEMRTTPRPPTCIRERLRHSWDLDWDDDIAGRMRT